MKRRRPHNCVHCSFMTCGDANWCSERNETFSYMQIIAPRKCPMWEWNPINALTLEELPDEVPDDAPRAVLDQMMLEVDA